MSVLCTLVLARMSAPNNFATHVTLESLGRRGAVKLTTEKIIERVSVRIGLSAGQRVRDQRETQFDSPSPMLSDRSFQFESC